MLMLMFTYLASLCDLWFTVTDSPLSHTRPVTAAARHTTHYTWKLIQKVLCFSFSRSHGVSIFWMQLIARERVLLRLSVLDPGSLGGGRRELKFCHLFEYRALGPTRGYILIQLSLGQQRLNSPEFPDWEIGQKLKLARPHKYFEFLAEPSVCKYI